MAAPTLPVGSLHKPGITPVKFRYRATDGSISIKTVQPVDWYYGTTPCHPEPGLVLRGLCLERREVLRYPVSRIVEWIT